jgi:hypothetical protein
MRALCPSRLAGIQRKMTVREVAEMAESYGRGGTDGGFWRVLDRVWESTLDAGPYPWIEVGSTSLDVKRLVMVDAHHMLVSARIVTHGRWHEIPYTCPDCRTPNVVDVDLIDDLPLRPIKDATFDHMRTGKPFEARMLTGKRINFRILTVEHDESIGRVRQQLERDVKAGRRAPLPKRGKADMFAAQTTFIEDLGEEKSRDQKARLDFFLDLTVDEETNFADQVAEHDFGYDDQIHHICENEDCRRPNGLIVPLDREFFRPSRLTKRQKAERETAKQAGQKTDPPTPATPPTESAAEEPTTATG